MADKLSGSVGKHGKNDPTDVTVVQQLLLEHGFRIGRADGVCGPKTLEALLSFQRGFLKAPDGMIDPGGLTWHHLTKTSHFHAPLHPSSFARLVPRPPKSLLNAGLSAANNAYMTEAFGSPRDTYSQDCQSVTNVKLKQNLIVATVGKFKVQGLAPAVNSLQEVFSEIKVKQPDVYDVLGTAGMFVLPVSEKLHHFHFQSFLGNRNRSHHRGDSRQEG
jgi:peptidoglycan hydrolase-like protein with peptidoglycan-binding domain